MIALAIAGCGKSSGQKEAAKAAPVPTPTVKSWKAKEAWRTPLATASPRHVAPLPDGSALVASSFADEITLGDATFTGSGEDLLVHRIGADGKLGPGVQLGGAGNDSIEGLVAAGDAAYLALRIEAPVTIAGKTLSPPAPDPALTFDMPSAIVIVKLDREGKPVAAFEAFTRMASVVLAALPDGDLVAVGSASERKRAEVVRFGPDGTPRWKITSPGIEGNALAVASPTELVLSVRADNKLGLWVLDAATGKGLRTHELGKPADTMDDLGELSAAQRLGDIDIALGSTGGRITLDGKTFDGSNLHPFFVTSSAQRMTYEALPDLVASPTGSGSVRGAPFFGLQVIHTAGHPTIHRGTYLVAYGEKPQLLPLYQYRYENDDWENAPKQVVLGASLSGSVVFAGDSAWIAGRCTDAEPLLGCVARIDLVAE